MLNVGDHDVNYCKLTKSMVNSNPNVIHDIKIIAKFFDEWHYHSWEYHVEDEFVVVRSELQHKLI